MAPNHAWFRLVHLFVVHLSPHALSRVPPAAQLVDVKDGGRAYGFGPRNVQCTRYLVVRDGLGLTHTLPMLVGGDAGRLGSKTGATEAGYSCRTCLLLQPLCLPHCALAHVQVHA